MTRIGNIVILLYQYIVSTSSLFSTQSKNHCMLLVNFKRRIIVLGDTADNIREPYGVFKANVRCYIHVQSWLVGWLGWSGCVEDYVVLAILETYRNLKTGVINMLSNKRKSEI